MLTLLVRALVIPLYRRQLVSQRRMQLLQPEIKEIQRRYKGDAGQGADRAAGAVQGARHQPAGRLPPLLLQMPLLFIMYSVIQNGLTNQDPTAMLKVFGHPGRAADLHQHRQRGRRRRAAVHRHGHPALRRHRRQQAVDVPQPRDPRTSIALGLSILAIASAALQLVQSRMMLPRTRPEDDDPNTKIQRQTMLFLPLISVAYGGFLPAGLFIYWITATIFSIVQQYLIVGWGGMFPLFGWTPGFATDHTPRFPVSMPPPPEPGKRAAILTDADKKTTAASTIRPRERGRQGRRGRRR